MRLAWFSPWPPQSSGIARCSFDLTRALAARGHAVDVFVDREQVPGSARWPNDAPQPGQVRVQSAHDFVWRHQRGQYDLNVYQLGNSAVHNFEWPYLLRYPGLTMLHDAHLHHSRGAQLITPVSPDAYRAAFAADHPDVNPDVAELAIAGFDGAYYYFWPMIATAVRASRAVGVHARGWVANVRATSPGTPVEAVALGMGQSRPVTEAQRSTARGALKLPADAVVFGVFGGLTADKRVPEVLRAFARLRRVTARAHLLLAGRPDPRLDLDERIGRDLEPHVTVVTHLDDDAFEQAIAAVDVSLNLRWPTAREVSGPWLQALAAGRPTVTLALEHLAHVPALDPSTWTPKPGTGAEPPVTVAVDVLDEASSLESAMVRLATDVSLRDRLGRAARAWWEREHTPARMADDYERVMALAAARPVDARLPLAAADPDPLALTHALARPFGDLTCTLF